MDSTIEDRRAFNALLPISKLNDDILAHLFMFNTYLDFAHPGEIPSATIRHTSQVCQRWRDLLLNYPLIWAASVEFNDPQPWIDVVIARAGSAPLTMVLPSVAPLWPSSNCQDDSCLFNGCAHFQDITFFQKGLFHSPPTEHELAFALSLFPRSRRFMITVDSRDKAQSIAREIDLLKTSHLEECTLYLDLFTEYDEAPVHPWIPVDLNFSSPLLKVLDLQGFWTNFHSPIFRNLNRLSVYNPPTAYGRALRPTEWLEVLRCLPQLEELNLNEVFTDTILAFNPDDPSLETHGSPVTLSRLQRLALHGFWISCHEILSQLTFPSYCGLTFHYRGLDGLGGHWLITSELCKKLRLSTEFQASKKLALKIYQNHRDLMLSNCQYFQSKGNFRITLKLATESDNKANILPEIAMYLIQIFSPSVNDLYFDLLGFEPSQAATLLLPFEQVQTLRLRYSLSTIASMHYQHGFVSNPSKTLPQLSRIDFYMVQIDNDVAVQHIVKLVQKRSEIKLPIKHVLLKNCWGSHLETLRTNLKTMGVEPVELADEE